MALSSASRRFSARRGALKGRFRQTVLLYLFAFFFVVRGTVIQVKEFAQSICPPTHFYYSLIPKREKEEDKKRKRKKKIHDAARRHRLTTVASIVVMWGRPPSSPRRRGGGGEHRRPNARAAGATTTTVFGAATQKSRLPPRERGGPSPSPSLLFRSKTSLSGALRENQTRSRERAMRALISTNTETNATRATMSSTKSRVAQSRPGRAQSTIGVPPRHKKKDHQPHFGQTTTLSSSSFGTGPPPQPSSRKRELTKTTTEQHAKNGRQTAPPIAPKIKLREPPVLAKQPTTAAQRKRDQQVFIREGPSWMKAPSLLTSKATSKKATTTTTTTAMTKSTVFGRQNGAEKQRQETIATSEVKLEKQLKKKIEDTVASPGQKRTLCKEALDDVVRKSNLFRGRLELIRDVIFNDDDENENDENERKNRVKCLVCAENAETIRKLENSLRIEKLERSNVKRDNTDAMKTIAELRADVTQLGKIISRVFRSEIKPRELKEIAAKFLDATSSEKHERIEDDDDDEEEEEENQWTPLPKTSKFYGLPVEEISWGRTLSPRVMSPGYPVPKLDFSLVTNSVDAEEDGYGSNSTSSSVLSDDSFYDDQEEEEEEEENKDDNDDDDDDNNNNTEDEDAEVDRWLNS